MPEKKHSNDNDFSYNINDNDQSNSNQNEVYSYNSPVEYQENIPQNNKEEQAKIDKKRNDPNFDNDLQNLLPKDDNVSQLKEDKNPENLNAMIEQWQKEVPPADPEKGENSTGLPDERQSHEIRWREKNKTIKN